MDVGRELLVPEQVDVRPQPIQGDQVDGPVANDLEGDLAATNLDIGGLGSLHPQIVTDLWAKLRR
jgi:hypothetical protein